LAGLLVLHQADAALLHAPPRRVVQLQAALLVLPRRRLSALDSLLEALQQLRPGVERLEILLPRPALPVAPLDPGRPMPALREVRLGPPRVAHDGQAPRRRLMRQERHLEQPALLEPARDEGRPAAAQLLAVTERRHL